MCEGRILGLSLSDGRASISKKYLISGLIFLFSFPTAVGLCKVLGQFLVRINMIDAVQAKKFPSHGP
jgi:hypothetical protein